MWGCTTLPRLAMYPVWCTDGDVAMWSERCGKKRDEAHMCVALRLECGRHSRWQWFHPIIGTAKARITANDILCSVSTATYILERRNSYPSCHMFALVFKLVLKVPRMFARPLPLPLCLSPFSLFLFHSFVLHLEPLDKLTDTHWVRVVALFIRMKSKQGQHCL